MAGRCFKIPRLDARVSQCVACQRHSDVYYRRRILICICCTAKGYCAVKHMCLIQSYYISLLLNYMYQTHMFDVRQVHTAKATPATLGVWQPELVHTAKATPAALGAWQPEPLHTVWTSVQEIAGSAKLDTVYVTRLPFARLARAFATVTEPVGVVCCLNPQPSTHWGVSFR